MMHLDKDLTRKAMAWQQDSRTHQHQGIYGHDDDIYGGDQDPMNHGDESLLHQLIRFVMEQTQKVVKDEDYQVVSLPSCDCDGKTFCHFLPMPHEKMLLISSGNCQRGRWRKRSSGNHSRQYVVFQGTSSVMHILEQQMIVTSEISNFNVYS